MPKTKIKAEAARRINERLLEYWDGLRGLRAYPPESEINPADLADIWDACFLLRVDEDATAQGYKYTYLGTSLIEAYGDDLTNQGVSTTLITPSSPDIIQKFEEVRKGRPVMGEGEFTNKNNLNIRYRSCMLPLGDAGQKRVEYVLGGMKWKAF